MKYLFVFVFALVLSSGSVCTAQTAGKGDWNYCVAVVNWTVQGGNGIRTTSGQTQVYSTIFRSAKDPYADRDLFKKYVDNYYSTQHITYSYAPFTYANYSYSVDPVCNQGISPDNNPHQVAQSELNDASSSTWQWIGFWNFPNAASSFNGDRVFTAIILNSDDTVYDSNSRRTLAISTDIPDAGEVRKAKVASSRPKNRYDPKASLNTTSRPQ